jgi:hypothetical protein
MTKTMMLIILIAAICCTSMPKQSDAFPDGNLRNEMLQILDFTGGSNVPAYLTTGIPDQVAEQVGILNLYQKIGRGESFETGPSLLMVGKIVQYELETYNGRNAVRGHMVIDVMFIDKQTGLLHAAFNFSGPIDKDETSREIVEFIRQHH